MEIILAAEWVFFGCSLAIFSKQNDKKIRLLFFVALATILVESLGFYYRTVLNVSNHYLYNVSIPTIILLFQLLFLQNLEQPTHRIFVKVSMGLFIVFTLVNLFFLQGSAHLNTFTYIFGAILLVITASIFFLELIKRPVIISLTSEPMFYIACGVILLYLPKSVLYAVFEYLAYQAISKKPFGELYQYTNLVLSLIYFTLLSYASLCRLISRK